MPTEMNIAKESFRPGNFVKVLFKNNEDVNMKVFKLENTISEMNKINLTILENIKIFNENNQKSDSLDFLDDQTNYIDASTIHNGSVNNNTFGYLSNVTSDIQDQIDNTISKNDKIDVINIYNGSVDNNTFGYLSNLTSDIQDQIDSKISKDDFIDASKISNGNVSNENFDYLSNVNSDIQDQINEIMAHVIFKNDFMDASKVSDGSVTNEKFNYLGNVDSDIQRQINNMLSKDDLDNVTKDIQSQIDNTVSKDNLTNVTKDIQSQIDNTVSKNDFIDASKVSNGSVTNEKFNYLGNVTKDIQSQINNTVSKDNLTNIQSQINNTISKNDFIDASKISNGSVTNEKFNYLGNVTKDIQSQINNTISKNDFIDASKISNGNVTNEKFNYLRNVNSDIQDQLDKTINNSSENELINKTISYDKNTITGLVKSSNKKENPNKSDDTTSNYNYGSIIVNSENSTAHICLDPVNNNAKWIDVNERQVFFNPVASKKSFETAVSWIAGNRPYNNFKILVESKSKCEVRIYNETTQSTIASKDIAVENISIVDIVSPLKYYPPNTIMKLQITDGTLHGMTMQ